MMTQTAASKKRLDVVLFDSSRAWTAYLMRQVVRQGLRPKIHRTATGFNLIDWSVTMAAVFDVEDARPDSTRVAQAADAISRLVDRHPAVCRIVLVDEGNPAEWLLREAGAVAVFRSVIDVAAIASLLQRQSRKVT